jgi:hypothetical protein
MICYFIYLEYSLTNFDQRIMFKKFKELLNPELKFL